MSEYRQILLRVSYLALVVVCAAACAAALGLSIVYPTVHLLVSALGRWEWDAVFEGAGRAAILNTLFICFVSVGTSGVVGTALAFFVARFSFPGRGALAALAYLPFALPPLAGTLSFYYLIGSDGLFPRWVHSVSAWDSFAIEGPIAILLIHTYSFSVFFYAMVSAALEGMDVSQVEAARTLGASQWRAFWRVTVPMLMPALLGASLLTFMSSGASFSAPLFFGNDFPYLSVQIFNERTQFHEGAALTLSVVLGCVSLLGVLIFRSRQDIGGTASKGVPRELRSHSGRALAGLAAWACMAVLLVPHLNILWLSLVDHREWYTELVPMTFTLDNYTSLFEAEAFRPIRNSVWMSVAAAAGTMLIGLPAAYLIGRRKPGGRLVNVLVMIPWALPGTVVGMNLISSFNYDWLPLYGTVLILPLAYFVRFIPLWTRIAAASVTQFDASLIEAGQTLGGSRWFCFRRLVLPLMAPSLVAATALVFASCLGEFVSTILLYTPSNLPIAIRIYMEWRGAGVGSAFAYSVFLMVLVT
ncbi:MAG: iron ABC transporter permease, partial [Anaerolineales bacterium]|nr:iron ABC transporter permease [Anaerolineales bacterium]